ncbi:hypothetical protein ACFOD9_06395 [Novosphingobium bradum]|uniref:Uncharacterized protein n=1 Tax=Novosphingobium bradum TaxID=1737444 RepID=A0ABV7IRN5_9SPHN
MQPELISNRLTGASEDALQEELYRLRATDGLPVILPTEERVRAMIEVAAYAGYDADLLLGEIGPNLGAATVEKIAVNAVMAGCLPEHFPVVLAAISALCDPRMDVTEMQVTTHQVAPLLLVSGPAVRDLAIASGFGALGYGHRANLAIGRAVRLCLINLGGVWPGASAMALLGQPGSIAYCLGEDAEASPFPPLHASLGLAAEASAVTVACVGSPISVLVPPSPDGEPMADRLLDCLAATIAGIGNNNVSFPHGTVVVVLNPDHAQALAREGLDRAGVIDALVRRAGQSAEAISRARTGRPSPDPDRFVPAIASADNVLVLVAGGSGVYSTVMVPWGGGPHGNAHVTREIVFNDACEVVIHA